MTTRSLRNLLAAQFFGAFNDNAWKLFVIVLWARLLPTGDGAEAASQFQKMAALVAFTLPLALFSLPAGAWADRFSKRSVIVGTKIAEVVLMGCGALLLAVGANAGPLVVLALMGVQSAVFGPAKYGILPEIVPHARLSSANGALGFWTFLAIILGTALAPPLLTAVGPAPAAAVLALLALIGLGFARRIEETPPAAAPQPVVATVRAAWRTLRADRTLWLAVLGSTFFWAIASLLGQNLLVYSEQVLRLGERWAGAPLGVYGVGVGLGSLIAGRLSAGKVEVGLIPLGALGLAGSVLALGAFAPGLAFTLILLGLAGVASGFLVVPLDALIQWKAPADRRGSVIALSNVFVFTGTLLGALAGGGMALFDYSSRAIFVGAGLATLLGTVWALTLLPEAFLRLCVFLYTHTIYRLNVRGRVNVPETGGVLLAPNHMSFVDGLFLMAAIDRPIRFLIEEEQYRRWWIRPLARMVGAIPVSSTGGTKEILRALRDAGEHLDAGEVVCVFPEGQITRTGQTNPFRRGLERIAKGRRAVIVPVHLDRVWGSLFSFSRGRFLRKLPESIPYPITVSFGAPAPPNTPVAELRRRIEELGQEAWLARKSTRPSLHRSFVKRVRRAPWRLAAADATTTCSRLGLLVMAILLARRVRPRGILLPPSVAGAAANLAAALCGNESVNLNYIAGRAAMDSAARQAGLETILTSRRFLEGANLELDSKRACPRRSAEREGGTAMFLEDLSFSWRQKLGAALVALFAPKRLLERYCGARRTAGPDSVATIVFSSGSTGEPKGVPLTHFNLDSNIEAVAQVFRPEPDDRLLGILPLFHSFGTLSLWFALVRGMPIVFHVNPVDAPAIGRLVEKHRLTWLLATPTFLQLYLRRIPPDRFGSLRLVLAGAEKLPGALCEAFEEQFGIRPLEGYGATECAPVIAASIPPHRAPGVYQPGSRRGFVGPPLPGVTVRVIDPDTGDELPPNTPGLLLVRGPNVMHGYLDRPDLTAAAFRDGWYITGDIALVDENGYIKITDRLSRFSKIGGEMVSHGAVEDALHEAHAKDDPSPQRRFVVVGIPDARKGERLAVLHTITDANIPELLTAMAEAGLPNLYLPREDAFIKVEEIPLLGTGKLDLRAARERAMPDI